MMKLIFIALFGASIVGHGKEACAAESSEKTSMTYQEVWKKTAGPFSGDIFLLTKRGNFFLEEKDFKPESMYSSAVKGKSIPKHPISMHGFAWDYDLRIPIVFFDPTGTWIKQGSYSAFATQQDIAPTLAHILDIPAPARAGGRMLTEALQTSLRTAPPKTRPRAIVVLVQDQMGQQYLSAHKGVAKFYESMINNGANFLNGAVSQVDAETSVGHAAIGTGAWPPETGISTNDFFHPGFWDQIKSFQLPTSTKKKDRLVGNPAIFFAPTLADVWTSATQGQAKIFSQAYAVRASVGMAGHGALFEHGFKTNVVWMDENDKSGHNYETDEKIYAMPHSHRNHSLVPYALALTKATHGAWFNHPLFFGNGSLDSNAVKASPAQSKWEGDLAVAAIAELKIGEDDITDLVFVNTKATDACGHRYGYESDECRQVLEASDEAAKKIVDKVATATGGRYIVVLTADHGVAALPEISGATRFSRQRLIKDLNSKFDQRPNHIDVIQALTSSQLYVNRGELAANGFTIQDIVKFLKAYKVPFQEPFNAMANEWIRNGKAKEQIFFEDAIAKEDL